MPCSASTRITPSAAARPNAEPPRQHDRVDPLDRRCGSSSASSRGRRARRPGPRPTRPCPRGAARPCTPVAASASVQWPTRRRSTVSQHHGPRHAPACANVARAGRRSSCRRSSMSMCPAPAQLDAARALGQQVGDAPARVPGRGDVRRGRRPTTSDGRRRCPRSAVGDVVARASAEARTARSSPSARRRASARVSSTWRRATGRRRTPARAEEERRGRRWAQAPCRVGTRAAGPRRSALDRPAGPPTGARRAACATTGRGGQRTRSPATRSSSTSGWSAQNA